jgi:hypothetical protein
MKKIKDKIAIRKFRTIVTVFLLLASFLVVLYPNFVHAVNLEWFEDTKNQTKFLNNPIYEPYLKEYDGNLVKSMFVQLGWLLVKGVFLLTNTIQKLIPDALSLFSFVESTGLTKVYKEVVSTVVVGLMVLSLIIIGYKMITGKGSVDLKSVGMNVVMSIALIILMPTLIGSTEKVSGILFAKGLYKDTTSINNNENNDIAWSLIKGGVTDLAYINKTDQYNRIGDTTNRNNITKKNFYRTDFTQVLTSDVLDKMEKENTTAENLRYRLVPDSDNKFVATKFEDNFLSTFSDNLKTGYYRYPTNIFGILCGLTALAVAYVFNAFVIITAILELAFKRILGVVVFATDLETGQRSKMVLSDILQCYLTIGFQGFGLSMFAMFINFLNSGEGTSINFAIKIIAYICAVFVLIKGSGTVMRYFGVDIGLKEGYGQLASAFGTGAMLMRKGSGFANMAKGNKNNGGGQAEGDDRKPEKNFGESLSKKAGKAGSSLGYAKERGLSGLASDSVGMATNTAKKPFKNLSQLAQSTGSSFKEGLNDGTISAVKKGMKPSSPVTENNSNKEKEFNSTMPTRLSSRQDGAKTPETDRVIPSSERMKQNSSNMQQVQSQMQQDLKQRIIKASESETNQAREEFVQQKRQEAKYTPEALSREEMMKQRTQGLTEASKSEKEAIVRENLQGTGNQSLSQKAVDVQEKGNTTSSQSGRIVDVRENLQGTGNQSLSQKAVDVQEKGNTTSSQSGRIVDVRENLQNTSVGQTNKAVDVQENVLGATGSQSSRTVDVRESLQGSSTGQTNKTVNVQENVLGGTGSQNGRTVDVRENLQNTSVGQTNKTVNVQENVLGGTGSQSSRTVDVRENLQGSSTGQTNKTVNVQENVLGGTGSQSSRTVDVRENLQGASTGQTNKTVNVQENILGGTGNQSGRTVDVRENLQGSSTGQTNKTVNVQENVLGGTGSQSSRTVDVRENLQGASTGQTNKTVNVQENVLGGTGSQSSRTVDVRENLQGASTGQTNKTVNVQENVLGGTGSQSSRTVDVRENLQGASIGQTNKTVNVQENVLGGTGSQSSRTVDVRENLQNVGSVSPRTAEIRERVIPTTSSQSSRVVNVQENILSSGEKTQKINIVEDRQSAKKLGDTKETIVIDKEIRERNTSKGRFTLDNNPLFRDVSNKPNSLFNFDNNTSNRPNSLFNFDKKG